MNTHVLHTGVGLKSQGDRRRRVARSPEAGAAGQSGQLRCSGVARDRGKGISFPALRPAPHSLGSTLEAPLEEPPPTGHSEKRPPTAGTSPQKPPSESAVSSALAENPKVAPGRGMGARRIRPRLSPWGLQLQPGNQEQPRPPAPPAAGAWPRRHFQARPLRLRLPLVFSGLS